MKLGPFRVGRLFYLESSTWISGLQLFRCWIYSRIEDVSRFSLLGLKRWRDGGSVNWYIFRTPDEELPSAGRYGGWCSRVLPYGWSLAAPGDGFTHGRESTGYKFQEKVKSP